MENITLKEMAQTNLGKWIETSLHFRKYQIVIYLTGIVRRLFIDAGGDITTLKLHTE